MILKLVRLIIVLLPVWSPMQLAAKEYQSDTASLHEDENMAEDFSSYEEEQGTYSESSTELENEDVIEIYAESEETQPENTADTVSVIDALEIKSSGARNLSEILPGIPGVQVSRLGHIGSLSTVSIRGSSNEQVLILINGKRLNSPYGGGVDLSLVPLENVKRIEIYRGGSSARFGDAAFGGVINIITEDADEKPFSIGVMAEGGSYYTFLGNLHLSQFFESIGLSYAFDFYSSYSLGNYGYEIIENIYGQETGSYGTRENSEFFFINGLGNIQYAPKNSEHSFIFDFGGLYRESGSPGTIEFPTPNATQEIHQYLSGLSYRKQSFLWKIHHLSLNLSFIRQNLYYTDPDYTLSKSLHKNIALDFGITGDILYAHHHGKYSLLYRYDWLQSNALDSTGGEKNEEPVDNHNFAFSLFYEWKAVSFSNDSPMLLLSAIGRLDVSSLYSPFPSFTLGGIVYFDDEKQYLIKIRGGNAYRQPSYADLFWSQTAFSVGNPDLLPEDKYFGEFGTILRPWIYVRFEGTAFLEDIRNLIIWQPGPGGVWSPKNERKVVSYGMESAIAFFIPVESIDSVFEVKGSYTVQFFSIRSGSADPATQHNQVARRPYEMAGFSFLYMFAEYVSLKLQGHYMGFRYVNNANTKYYNDYLLLDLILSLSYEGFELQGKIFNLLDTSYIDLRDYPVPGISYYLRLSYYY